jgi:hypothetical protein
MKRSELRQLILEEFSVLNKIGMAGNKAIHGAIDAVGDATTAVSHTVQDAMIDGEKLDLLSDWDTIPALEAALTSAGTTGSEDISASLMSAMLSLATDGTALDPEIVKQYFDNLLTLVKTQAQLGRK